MVLWIGVPDTSPPSRGAAPVTVSCDAILEVADGVSAELAGISLSRLRCSYGKARDLGPNLLRDLYAKRQSPRPEWLVSKLQGGIPPSLPWTRAWGRQPTKPPPNHRGRGNQERR